MMYPTGTWVAVLYLVLTPCVSRAVYVALRFRPKKTVHVAAHFNRAAMWGNWVSFNFLAEL